MTGKALAAGALSGLVAAGRDARAWARGRAWQPRAVLLAYLGYGLVRHLADPLYGTFLFGGITLGIHELGHVVTIAFGPFLCAAAGSAFQIAAPVATVCVFRRQGDWFGMVVGGMWLSFSLFNLGAYIGDARALDLPLVTVGGGEAEHDWNYLLEALHVLPLDRVIGFVVRAAGLVVGAVSLTAGAWLLRAVAERSR